MLEDGTGPALLFKQIQPLPAALSCIYTGFPLLALQILNAACCCHLRPTTTLSMQWEI